MDNTQVPTESKCVSMWGRDLGVRVLHVYRWSSDSETAGFPPNSPSSQEPPRRVCMCVHTLQLAVVLASLDVGFSSDTCPELPMLISTHRILLSGPQCHSYFCLSL